MFVYMCSHTLECNYDITKITSLNYYTSIATGIASATGNQATLVCVVYPPKKHVGGSNNPDFVGYVGSAARNCCVSTFTLTLIIAFSLA